MSTTEKLSAAPLFSRACIEEQIRVLAKGINSYYAGKDLLMICILKGAFIFFSDLVRHINVRPRLDFMRIASYGDSTQGSADIELVRDVELDLRGRHVLVVEDIVDTGRSMDFLLKLFSSRGVADLRLCALLDKLERREVDIRVDFSAFSFSSGFVVGYGLDYAEKYRELPEIYILEVL